MDWSLTPCAQLGWEKAEKIFFSEESKKRQAEAKALCSACPMVQACLDLGMEMEYGIFGGLTPAERKAL